MEKKVLQEDAMVFLYHVVVLLLAADPCVVPHQGYVQVQTCIDSISALQGTDLPLMQPRVTCRLPELLILNLPELGVWSRYCGLCLTTASLCSLGCSQILNLRLDWLDTVADFLDGLGYEGQVPVCQGVVCGLPQYDGPIVAQAVNRGHCLSLCDIPLVKTTLYG